jgi:RNA polymerase sigma-70 factor (ECF subfamily)
MANRIDPLWDHFHERLFKFIRRRVEDDDAAEDLLQEVFLRIHSRMETLNDASRLESWIYQIARNAIIDHYRRRRDLIEIPDTVPAEDVFVEPDASDVLAASMREMVEELPEPYRQALLLTEYEGLTQAELADRLNISLSGAKSRVQRARQKIKDALLACCHFEFDRYGRVIDYWEHCCCCAGSAPANMIFIEDL